MRAWPRWRTALALGALILPIGVDQPAGARSDVVLEWNQIATDTFDQLPEGDPTGWRGVPIAQVAVFEAVNAIEQRYEPYVSANDRLVAPAGASPDAAAVAAAYHVLRAVYPKQTWLDDRYKQSLKAIADAGKTDGVALGKAAAARTLELRRNDGWNHRVSYKSSNGPGLWRPTPPDYAAPYGMSFAGMRPWTMTRPDQFRPGPPPALDSTQYAADLNEVKDVGARDSHTRGSEETQVARFWLGIPVVHEWHKFARDAASAAGLDRSQASRLLALVSMSYMDAVIATFDAKFFYNQWRPVTAIRQAQTDGNDATSPDPRWLPLADVTPPFPDYVSAHCATLAAPLAVIKAATGDRKIVVSGAGMARSYPSLDAFRDECVMARVWAGIHTRTSDVIAIELGTQIGHHAMANYLRPSARNNGR